MSESDTTTETLTVTFDRIGRTHNPPPLSIAADLDGDSQAEAIHGYARKFLGSRDTYVQLFDDGVVWVHAGGRDAGSGRITPWPTEAKAADR